MNAEKLLNNLLNYYNLKNMSELSNKLETSQSVISNWKARNAVGAIVEKINEIDSETLGHIFGTTINNLQGSNIGGAGVDNSHGSSHTYNNHKSDISKTEVLIPEFIVDDLNILFKRAKGNEDQLIAAIDEFIADQKKTYR